jgi:hypothetical protein
VRVGAHAPVASGREFGQFGPQAAATVEQLGGRIAFHPLLEDVYMLGVFVHLAHRHLVGAPEAFGAPAVDLLRAGPTLGCAQHDHRPARTPREPARARVGFDAPDLLDNRVQRRGHQLVHCLRVVALDKVRCVSVAAEKMVELLVADSREDRRIGDLVAVEV